MDIFLSDDLSSTTFNLGLGMYVKEVLECLA